MNIPINDENPSQELVISRVFDAPRSSVWKAFTDPKRVAEWWGPKDFISPVCKIDLKVGGTYLYCMRSPEDEDFWSTGTYKELIDGQKIVCTDSFADEFGAIVPAAHYGMSKDYPLEMLVTITFEDQDNKTLFTLKHGGIPSSEDLGEAEDGWNQSLDKLAQNLKYHKEG